MKLLSIHPLFGPGAQKLTGKRIAVIPIINSDEEEKYIIAQATEAVNPHGKFINKLIAARKKGETVTVKPNEVDYIDAKKKLEKEWKTALTTGYTRKIATIPQDIFSERQVKTLWFV